MPSISWTKPAPGNRHETTRLHEPGERIQVEIICAIVDEGIDRHDSVEETCGERQRQGVDAQWEDAVLDPGVLHALEILRGVKPKVRRPNLHAELAAQEDGRDGPPAAKVEHAHPRSEIERLGKPFCHPERIGSAAHASADPIGVISRGTGESR